MNYKFSNTFFIKILRDFKYYISAPKEGFAHYTQLSINPPIFYSTFNKDLRPLFMKLRRKRSYFLYAFWSNFSNYLEFKQIIIDHKRRYPEHEIIAMCNTENQLFNLRGIGVKAEYVNHNAFIDEHIFKPLSEEGKKYNAVYDAQIAPFKRHHLALKIQSLALITYIHTELTTPEYTKKIRSLFSYAYWPNFMDDKWVGLDYMEVNKILNQCHVGLCLSESEGAMYASIQYLLAGLPIVSTYSDGGRDVFFDPEYVIIVPPNADSVNKAVNELIERKVKPEFIRENTIERLKKHRGRFQELIQSIYDREKNGRSFSKEWEEIYYNKLLRYQKLSVKKLLKNHIQLSPWL